MLPQPDDFQHALCREGQDEGEVDPGQNIFDLHGLIVCLHHHCHHVEANQHHDEDVKKLFGDQVKDQSLELILVTEEWEKHHTNYCYYTVGLGVNGLGVVPVSACELTSGRGIGFCGFLEPSFFIAL